MYQSISSIHSLNLFVLCIHSTYSSLIHLMHSFDQFIKSTQSQNLTINVLLINVLLISPHHLQTARLQIYTWPDATLKELTNLVKEVNPDARRKGTIFDFALIFPETHSNAFRIRDIGTTTAGFSSPDDDITLQSVKFQIGDFLDICITNPQAQRDRLMERMDRGPRRGDRMGRY